MESPVTHARARALARGVVALALVSAGCSSRAAGGADAATTAPERSVVALHVDGASKQRCSAVVVGARRLVTARHCVSDVRPGPFACDGGRLTLSLDGSGRFGRVKAPAALAVVAGGRRLGAVERIVVGPDDAVVCGHDVAYLELDRDIELPILATRADVPTAQEELGLIGIGASTDDVPVLRHGRLAEATRGEDRGAELLLLVPSCPGDSGGAVVDASGRLLGIVSRGDSAMNGPEGSRCGPADGRTIAHRAISST